jgi:hypothetical protein
MRVNVRGNVMSNRNSVASVLTACLLSVGFLGISPLAAADSDGRTYLKPGKIVKSRVTVRPRARGPRIPLPIGPSSVYCDYPYYYSRGHYPTHIGGYVYYPFHYRTYC